MAKLDVLNRQGQKSDQIDIPDGIFSDRINKNVIYQAVVMYQASQRQGNASTKTRAEVSGGGIKPYRQKGTGRARAGSIRSPLWVGGGVTFGPKPREFRYSIPRKVKTAALRESLNIRLKDKDLICTDDFIEPLTKTKEFAAILKSFSFIGKRISLLIVGDGSDPSLDRVSRNIPGVKIKRSQDVNAYDVLKHRKILLTKSALKNILNRIRK